MGMIAEILSNKGCPRKFSMKTIKDVFHQPIYAGYVKWGDLLYKSKHDYMVEKKEFEKVQKNNTEKSGTPTLLGSEKV